MHTTTCTPAQLLAQLHTAFAQKADPLIAVQQQRYMKSTMAYWGIKKPVIDQICRELFAQAKPVDNAQYVETLEYLFTHATKREEWYAAIVYARKFSTFIIPQNVPVYMQLVLRGQWWDIVDDVSVNLIGKALCTATDMSTLVRAWIVHDNMWVRRTALLVQLKYKQKTDFELLTHLIATVAHEKEFFIRKAIGWVLREYSKTNPEVVYAYVTLQRSTLSPLSVREGLRCIPIQESNSTFS